MALGNSRRYWIALAERLRRHANDLRDEGDPARAREFDAVADDLFANRKIEVPQRTSGQP